MGRIGEAFAGQVGDLITYNAKVVRIRQSAKGVEVIYEDRTRSGSTQKASADWCVCTIPPTILGQIDINVGAPMLNAINAIPFAASVKMGLQFKRRFWEEDDRIYGGISYTDLPISQISYPNSDFNTSGKGVLLGGYTWNGANSFEFTSMSPQERVKRAVEFGAQIHPQYPTEFDNGVAVAWQRVPFTLGCASDWTEKGRKDHYSDLCQIDGRIVLAGEHASYLPAWQEGAILSSLDAITRLHKRVLQG
jgi:monoamine oxidase